MFKRIDHVEIATDQLDRTVLIMSTLPHRIKEAAPARGAAAPLSVAGRDKRARVSERQNRRQLESPDQPLHLCHQVPCLARRLRRGIGGSDQRRHLVLGLALDPP